MASQTFKSEKSLARIREITELLKERGGACAQDLASATGMARWNIASYLHHMEKLGLVVCTEAAVPRFGGSTGAHWELVAALEEEQPEHDYSPRKVIVRKQWERETRRDALVAALFGVPQIMQSDA